MERATARLASHCGNETSLRNVHKRCATTRSNRRFAVATARAPHTRALHVRDKTGLRNETRGP
eukprot:4869860-Lingulodinium_polyedra.AAC.1